MRAEIALEGERIGVANPRASPLRWLYAAPHQALGGANIEPAAYNLFGERAGSAAASSARACPADSSPSSSRWRTGAGNDSSRTVLATWLRLLPTASARLAWVRPNSRDQPAVGFGLFERRQILALQVFDQRDLEHFGIGERADDDRHLMQPDALRRAPAALAGDQLEGGIAPSATAAPAAAAGCPFRGSTGRAPSSSASAKRRRGCKRAGPDQLDRHARRSSAWVRCRSRPRPRRTARRGRGRAGAA